MATIKEIAEIVGVSSAAVSRVLNYDEGISVSAETRAAIFAAAAAGRKESVLVSLPVIPDSLWMRSLLHMALQNTLTVS